MAIKARLQRLQAEEPGPAVLVLGLAFMAWAFFQGLFVDSHPDETVYIGLARLVSAKVRLYRELRCQHSPLIVAIAQPFAALGWVHEPWPYRLLVLLAQSLAALSLALSPAFAGRRAWGWAAGAAYACLYGAWGMRELGHCFTDYAFSGAAWVAAMACVGLPAALGRLPGPRASFWGGVGLALGVLGSPATGLAGLLFAAAVCLSLDPAGRRAFAAGMAAVAAGGFFWMLCFGDFRGAWDLVVVYNLRHYSSLANEPDLNGLLSGAWVNLRWTLRNWDVFTALFLAWPVYLLWEALRADAKRRLVIGLLALAYAAIHVRLYFWKALPYTCSSYAGLAAGAALFVAAFRGRPRAALELAAALGLLASIWSGWHMPKGPEHRLLWRSGPARLQEAELAAVAQGLPPGASLLALPHEAQRYMLSDFRIAAWTVTYGPSDALMDFPPGAPPRACNLCEGLRRDPPDLIYHATGAVMYGKPVDPFLPACLWDYERQRCEPVPGLWGWWMRRELLPAHLAARSLPLKPAKPKRPSGRKTL